LTVRVKTINLTSIAYHGRLAGKNQIPVCSMYLIYNILLSLSAIVLIPYYGMKILLTGKYRESIGPKFGLTPRSLFKAMSGAPRIWVHAVSVGEVTAAAPIVASLRELFPQACIVLSTSTETGRKMALGIVPEATCHIYYPLDIPCIVTKVIGLVKPDIFVPVETEIWPNFIRACRDAGIGIVMVNGRISPRSFKRYRITRFFWQKVLGMVDGIGVISGVDAERLQAIGVHPSRIRIVGNAKFDSLAARVDPVLRDEMAQVLNVREGERILVAGSTHEGEDEIVFRVYREVLEKFHDLRLILVPRHIERTQDVVAAARQNGFSDAITMTEIRKGKRPSDERVIIIDVIGELFKVYSLATVVFCGGSLVPRGGQNILEAAAWGKVVFYGPSMDDFMEEKALLEEVGAGISITDGEDLYRGILNLMNHPTTLMEKGQAARNTVAANRGASRRYAELIVEALGKKAVNSKR
jgi:3-deoxy-D-manno-octulosonic-acid transferase